jgi:putative ABC transport system permease protein
MKTIRSILRRFRSLGRARLVKHEIDEELRFHIEQRTAENIAAGMAPEDAARDARKHFGNFQTLREECREARGTGFVETTVQDIRFALRMLRKSPGFTAVVVLMLALGIGASTAIYSVVNTVLLNPVPGLDADRLFEIGERTHGNKDEPRFGGLSARSLEMVRSEKDLFSDVVWMDRLDLEGKTEDFIESTGCTAVSPNFFSQWNIKPILGRTFAKDEAVRRIDYQTIDRDSVIVLSYSLWQSRFGGQADALGKTIDANGRHFTIIGIMPPHFQFPNGAYPTSWIPVQNPNPIEHLGNIHVFVRLKPGVTVAQTQAKLDILARRLVQEDPGHYDDSWHRRGGGFGLLARPLSAAFTQGSSQAADLHETLFGLLAAIAFVLLIACVNVANLMLARTEKRQQEFAIRGAVGAGRVRLMRQLLTESLVLASFGALAGLVITLAGMKLLVNLIPPLIPRIRAIHIDSQALGFTLLISIGTVLAFGFVPAWQAGRTSVGNALKRAGSGVTISRAWRHYRGALVVIEVALSLVLLAGAGLMIESVIHLLHVNPGFDPDNLVFVHAGLLRSQKYDSNEAEAALYENIRECFASLPGVKAVGIHKTEFFQLGFTIEGQDKPIGLLPAGTGVGEGDAFRAMHTPFIAGRSFDKSDMGKTGTVIVNETMARLCWPGENALNKKFRDRYGTVYQVIGVVGDVRTYRYDEQVEPSFYRPYQEEAGSGGDGPYFAVRTAQNPQALIPALRDAMKSVETSMTVPRFQVVREKLYDTTQAQRTYMLYLVIFAGVGLLLSGLGIYGVLAYSVARRTREIGIRMAVGAQRWDVLRIVMGEGARLVLVGVGVGVAAAYSLTRLLRSRLFEVSPTDPVVMAEVVLLLCAVALVACYIPARRATNVDPMTALRNE